MERPDLEGVSPAVRAYIEQLEKRLKIGAPTVTDDIPDTPLTAELPTTICIISISREGWAKRTYRHLYPRQHRSGFGISDLDTTDPDYPITLVNAMEQQSVLLFTNKARVYRYSVNKITEAPVHARGELLYERYLFETDEYIAAALPERAFGYVAVLTESGRVRCLRHHLFGEHMRPGTQLFKTEDTGPLVGVCWTPGDADLFIATRQGQAIRFSEKLVSPQGDLAIRLGEGDRAVGVTSVNADSGVFLLSANGKGAVRLMSGFAPNKSSGGSGKIAMKTDDLVGVAAVSGEDEVFAVSRFGKIIRFRGDEVPQTEGVIQGVYCMSLRGDEVTAMLVSSPKIVNTSLY
jgi:DNA gyrase subunit A